MKIEDFYMKDQEFRFVLNDFVIEGHYNEDNWTVNDALKDAEMSKDPAMTLKCMCHYLSVIIVDWDLTEETKVGVFTVVETNMESLLNMPVRITAALINFFAELVTQPKIMKGL